MTPKYYRAVSYPVSAGTAAQTTPLTGDPINSIRVVRDQILGVVMVTKNKGEMDRWGGSFQGCRVADTGG